MTLVLYLLALLVLAFVISGVVPRYLEARGRRSRVQRFEGQYRAWAEASARAHPAYYTVNEAEEAKAGELRAWLAPRRDEMQRDAQRVGKGIVYVGPPPAVGGPMRPHSSFSDLFDDQSFTDHGTGYRLDELATTVHETRRQLRRRRRDLLNPWAWLRLAFERVVGFPRYVLRLAGFGENVTDSTGVKIGTALWSFIVGAAGIGSFILAALD